MDKAKTIISCGLAIGKDRRKIQRTSGIPSRTFDRRIADPDKLADSTSDTYAGPNDRQDGEGNP